MRLENLIVEAIDVLLDWDYQDDRLQVGVFEGQMQVEHERCDICFDLYVNVERQIDNGSYDQPPEFEDTVDIEVYDITIYTVSGEEVSLTAKQMDNLANEIKAYVEYE